MSVTLVRQDLPTLFVENTFCDGRLINVYMDLYGPSQDRQHEVDFRQCSLVVLPHPFVLLVLALCLCCVVRHEHYPSCCVWIASRLDSPSVPQQWNGTADSPKSPDFTDAESQGYQKVDHRTRLHHHLGCSSICQQFLRSRHWALCLTCILHKLGTYSSDFFCSLKIHNRGAYNLS